MKGLKYIGPFVFFVIIIVLSTYSPAEASGKISQGSTIANIPLEGATSEEAINILTENITTWYAEDVFLLTSDYETIEIPRSAFQFEIDATVEQLSEKMKRDWRNLFIKQKNVHLPLIVTMNETALPDMPDYIDQESTLESALAVAENLGEQAVSIEYATDPEELLETIAQTTLTVPDIHDTVTDHFIGQVNGIVIPALESFSYIDSVSLVDTIRIMNDEGIEIDWDMQPEMSFIATGIYDLALQTDLEVLERHSQRTVPNYTEAGVEARVDYQIDKDLLVYNPNSYAYFIDAEREGDEVTFTLEALSTETARPYTTERRDDVEARTIYRFSRTLPYGTSEVLQSKRDGYYIDVYDEEELEKAGENEEVEPIQSDYYPPRHEVILVSSADEPEEPEEILDEADMLDLLNLLSWAGSTEGYNDDLFVDEDMWFEPAEGIDPADVFETDYEDYVSEYTDEYMTDEGMYDIFTQEMDESFEEIVALCVLEAELPPEAQVDEEFSYCDLLGLYFFFAALAGMSEAGDWEDLEADWLGLEEELLELEEELNEIIDDEQLLESEPEE